MGLGKKEIILCGIESHVCVYQTAGDLLAQGYRVELIADAVSSRTVENKQIGIKRMQAEGADLSSTEMILFELLKDAREGRFRQVAELVK